MKILNLTTIPATPDQEAAGLCDLTLAKTDRLRCLLAFDAPPTPAILLNRATQIAQFAAQNRHGADAALILGPPCLVGPLTVALRAYGFQPMFAHGADFFPAL